MRAANLSPVVADLQHLAAPQIGAHQFWRGLQNDGRQQVVAVVVLGQQLFEFLVLVRGDVLHVDIGFGTAVAVTPVVIDDAAAHRAVGGLLFAVIDGRDDAQAAAVDVVGKRSAAIWRAISATYSARTPKSLTSRLMCKASPERLPLCVADEVELVHPAQDVALAQLRALRIGHRIVGRGCLGQPGEHGRLGDADILQGLAEVDLRRGEKP
jgi:hypothetical protein